MIASATEGASNKELLRELSRAAEVCSIPIGPLTTEDSRMLTRAVLQNFERRDAALVERIVSESQGLPRTSLNLHATLPTCRPEARRHC